MKLNKKLNWYTVTMSIVHLGSVKLRFCEMFSWKLLL